MWSLGVQIETKFMCIAICSRISMRLYVKAFMNSSAAMGDLGIDTIFLNHFILKKPARRSANCTDV